MSPRRLALVAFLLIAGYTAVWWAAYTMAPRPADALYLILMVGCLLGACWETGASRRRHRRHRRHLWQ